MPDERPGFEDWLAEVDKAMIGLVGMGRDDLPDWDYAVAYASGYTADEAAREAITEIAEEMGFHDILA
jgi:hypothetical protein